ncbi:MAG: type II toxin-antitoxin system RelE/ParE family toxin [Deltaproteobacteria bacterium]|nr:type II toxin-antitoxin system RelE/ParE family toxin [Deltaproteobacteria bacterium]
MIRFRPEARSDAQSAYDWYEDKESGLGDRLVDAIDALMDRVDANPRLFPKAHQEFRRAVLSQFLYCVYFVVEPACVLVVGVLHGRQDLRRLLERLRR